MFARLTTMSIKIDRIEDGIAIYRKSVIPAAKQQKGFMGAYLLSERSTGKAISITLWKTEEDAVANEKNLYYQEQLVKFIELFQSPPLREGYTVEVKA